MENDFKVVETDSRKIVVSGIGKMFYQDGFPIPMAITKLSKQGFEVSVLHIADELLKNGWKPDTVYKRLESELNDQIQDDTRIVVDWKVLKEFCFATYEEQRELLFKSLFLNKEEAKKWFNRTIK